jgi:phage anti-repressor protein
VFVLDYKTQISKKGIQMKEIITISKKEINGTEVNSVNAREIHKYLGVKTHLSTWIQRAIQKYDFKENIDFSILKSGNPNGGLQKIDYIVTLDMAKELAMLENNPKGRETRKYFIAVEKEFVKSLNKPDDTSTQVVLALNLMTKALETIVTQNQTILTMLQHNQESISLNSKIEVKFADKPNTRMMKRRLSNEDKFIAKVIDILQKEEGLSKKEILERAGYYKAHVSGRKWLDSYDGIYWRASVLPDCTYSFSLIQNEEEVA